MNAKAVVSALFLLSGFYVAGAKGATRQPARKGPLAKLPSKPGAHIQKIKALKDNAWLNLGAPKPDPKWGAGRGRSWSGRMPFAPDLRGAFLAGQGVHGYIRPDGRYDDIYFYDVNAHAWVCIYPGLNTKTFVEDIKKGAFKVNVDLQQIWGSLFGPTNPLRGTQGTFERVTTLGGGVVGAMGPIIADDFGEAFLAPGIRTAP